MRILVLVLSFIVLVATGLPLINSDQWWIRMFDFPRLQIAVLTLVTLVLAWFYAAYKWRYRLPLLLLLAVALIYQVQLVWVYTPLYRPQVRDSNNGSGANSFTLLVSNVRMDNEDKQSFPAMVRKMDPDVVLINEPDQAWADSLGELQASYPHTILFPLDNTYGMMLLSRLPLSESEVNFLVDDSIPSIFTRITLTSGHVIDFYGVHPEPPQPGKDTWERDTELLIIGRKIRERRNPSVVAGDLNDVGWSVTSKLFRKHSGLLDPREGRGLFNTYNVHLPLLRYPLDHIFHSPEFGLITLQKLEDIGSDHFPIFVGLSYEPKED